MHLTLKTAAALCLLTLGVGNALATEYFVDGGSSTASDSNTGTSDRPWRSLYAINGRSFSPGDIVTVRDGTYNMSSGGNWDAPIINLGSSGTSTSPIIVRAQNRHGAILDGGGNQANAPLGSSGRNWITFDGFVVRNTGPKGIAIFKATGITVQNCKISGVVWNTVRGDNTEGVRVEWSDQTTIRNNEITGIDSGSPGHWNGAAIKLYNSSNTIFENNWVHDYQGSAVFDKQGGISNTYRYNLIENITDVFVVNTVAGRPNRDLRFHNNVARNVASLGQETDRVEGDVYVFSNTFINFNTMGLRVHSDASTHTYYSYNNVFIRTASLESHMGELVAVDPNMLVRSDYNVYASTSPRWVTHQYESSQTAYNSLSAWRSAFSGKYDSNSIVTTVGLDSTNRMTTTSLKGFARTNGVASGSPIDPGAYSTGKEVIGISDQATVRPSAPANVTVE